jgi:hypothetical protein
MDRLGFYEMRDREFAPIGEMRVLRASRLSYDSLEPFRRIHLMGDFWAQGFLFRPLILYYEERIPRNGLLGVISGDSILLPLLLDRPYVAYSILQTESITI